MVLINRNIIEKLHSTIFYIPLYINKLSKFYLNTLMTFSWLLPIIVNVDDWYLLLLR
jgi:hypothetical protein